MSSASGATAAATPGEPTVLDEGPVRRLGTRRQDWLLAAGFAVLYGVYALTRYRQFLTAGYDLGIFDQAVRRYAHFQSPLVPLKGEHYNLLGDHFHPVLATLAPLYWVWDDPRTLLLAQAALVALSIPVVGAVMRRRLGSPGPLWRGRNLVVSLLLVGYALSWPVQRMVDFDFHEVCFAVPLLAVALDGLDRRDDRRLVLAGLALLFVREDMGMVLAMLALVRMLRPPRRWLGLLLAAVGAATFVLVTTVVLPHFASNGQFAYWTYDALGPDAPSAIRFILAHPLRTASILFTPWVKTRTLLYLFLPLLLLPLGSPLVLACLPLVAQRNLSSRTHLWTTEYHYSAPIMVILVLAAVHTLARVGRRWGERLQRRLVLAVVVAMALTPVVDAVTGASDFPLERLAWSAWRTKPLMRDQAAAVAHVPAGTCVAVDDRLAPHLTRTNRVTLPTLDKRTQDFVVLDMSQEEVGFPLPSPQVVQRQVKAAGYRVVFRSGPLIVWQRPGYAGPTPACAPTAP